MNWGNCKRNKGKKLDQFTVALAWRRNSEQQYHATKEKRWLIIATNFLFFLIDATLQFGKV